MTSVSVASVYAKTLYELALKEALLQRFYTDACRLLSVYKRNKDFRVFVHNPVMTKATKRQIVLQGIKPYVHDRLLAFLLFMIEKQRYRYLKEILDAFVTEYKHHHHIQVAEVRVAVPLVQGAKERFEGLVTKLTGHKRVELRVCVDASLLGGYVLQVGDRRIDASLAGGVRRLKYLLLQL